MNHSSKSKFVVEVPNSRDAIIEWYNADRNKRLIYYFSLLFWSVVQILLLTVLPLTATSSYRIAFYLPLLILIPLECFATHWLIQCALHDFEASKFKELSPLEAPDGSEAQMVDLKDL
jgi:hypothetical protein